MAVATFRARCTRTALVSPTGDKWDRVPVTCDETFEGAEGVEALKAHNKEHHKGLIPANHASAGWPLKPVAHKAPKERNALDRFAGAAKIADTYGDAVVVEVFVAAEAAA